MRSLFTLLAFALLTLCLANPALADDAFIVTDDAFLLIAGTSLSLHEDELLLNDTVEPWAHPVVTTDPSYGTLDNQWNDNEWTFVYTPNPGFHGRDFFSYRVGENQADVLLYVSPERALIMGRWPSETCFPVAADLEEHCPTSEHPVDGHGMEIGWYDSVGEFFHLCDWHEQDASGCVDLAPDLAEPLSIRGWTPVVIDIDGDTWDELALRNPLTGETRLFNIVPDALRTTPGALVEIGVLTLGASGDLPLTGDWVPAARRDAFGHYSFGDDPTATTGTLFLELTAGAGWEISTPQFVRPWPLAGDWLGRGKDQVGFYDLETSHFWFIDYKNEDTHETTIGIGPIPGISPVSGRTSHSATKSFLGFFDPGVDTLYYFDHLSFEGPIRPLPREVVVDPNTLAD